METRIITPITTSIGVVRIVWTDWGGVSKILKILLPRDVRETDVPQCSTLTDSSRQLCDNIEHIGFKIKEFFNGDDVVGFSAEGIDMTGCSTFQQHVFIQTCKIPRGMVMSYSHLSKRIGFPKGARAVGTALAKNPFPLIIPCHRVIRESGYLGGFGGGLHLKKLFLKKEGIAFDLKGRVLKSCFLI